MMPPVKLKRLENGAGLGLPAYETPGSAGADIQAAVDAPLTLAPGERGLIPAGFRHGTAFGF
jgi:dUTP pyrophosphatase